MQVFGCMLNYQLHVRQNNFRALVEVLICSPELLFLVLAGAPIFRICIHVEGLPPFGKEDSGTPVFEILNEPGCQLACAYHISLPILANSVMSAQTRLIVFCLKKKQGPLIVP